MYLFVSCSNLNTSHVLINQVLPPPRLPKIKYLNTSHVLINRIPYFTQYKGVQFKYISCSY